MKGTDRPKRPKLRVRELAVLGLLGAAAFALQVAMAPIPNVEAVTLLFMACAIVYGLKTLFPVYVFVLLETFVYGLGLWTVNYLYVWAILTLATLPLRKLESYWLFAVAAGAFGLFFGALCAIPYLFVGGTSLALSYWLSGVPFDLIHCAANAVISIFLLKPVVRLMRKWG